MTAARPLRVALVSTHPTQYYAPWFRHLQARCPELEVAAIYATTPTAEQQGVGFGASFQWDIPVLEGYRSVVVRPPQPGDNVHSSSFRGVDAPGIGRALRELRPDAALVFGWYSISLIRALWACKRQGIPTLYRGDTHLGNAPAGWRRAAWRLKTRFLLRRAFQGYLAVGSKAREYLGSFGVPPQRIFDSPHCVDNDFFAAQAAPHQTPAGRAAARARFGLPPDAFVTLFAGKLDDNKRVADLLSAVARLGSGAALLVVGSGPLEADLRRQAGELGVRAAFAGFLNQMEMGPAFGAADCVALPSASETWGLIGNEALASGLPVVLSDRVGAAPDLVVPGVTGEVHAMANVPALATALAAIAAGRAEGRYSPEACRRHAERFSFAAASAGLVAACRAVSKRREPRPPRALALFGYMYAMGGLERQSFEVLRTLRGVGGAVLVFGNRRPSSEDAAVQPIRAAAEAIGAEFVAGRFTYGPVACRSVGHVLKAAHCFVVDGALILWKAWRFRPTHVLVPDWPMALQSLLPLLLLRMCGVTTILRVGNAPERTGRARFVWSRLLPWGLTRMVANSGFGARRMAECGVPAAKIGCVYNRVIASEQDAAPPPDLAAWMANRKTLLCVGQVGPFKGTHLAVEATARLVAAGHDVQLLVVGRLPIWPDDLKAYVENLRAAAAPLGDRVRFAGELPQVTGLMRVAWLLLAPIPQEETFGNVVLEAKSAGLPAVTFANGGLPELVEHGVTGRISAEPTLTGLQADIEWFLVDSQRREDAAGACRRFFEQPDCPYRADNYAAGWRRELGCSP